MAASPQHHGVSDTSHIWVSQPQGRSNCYSDPEGRFAIIASGDVDVRDYLRMDAYSAAMAFVEGKFAVSGDIFSAIRFFWNQPRGRLRNLAFSLVARLEHLRTAFFLGSRKQAAQSIQFHYDRSNEFYQLFLDSRMIYSEADFSDPHRSLDEAQAEKLDAICQALKLQPGDRFLDIGCGWGGLITYAAERYGVTAVGCTLSQDQMEFGREAVKRQGLTERVRIELSDYRDLRNRFDKIASVGMFEHVAKRRLGGYFKKVHSLLEKNGLFLNRGIVRPPGVSDGSETLFLQKNVFPASELVHLDDVVRQGERAGFEIIGTEDLRTHYALTCRAWVKNLQQHAERCRELVGEKAYRTWVLYLAASAVSFEEGHTGDSQVLFARR